MKVSLTRDQVRQAPEYKADEPVVVLEGAPTENAPDKARSRAPRPGATAPAGHNQDSPAH